MESHVCGECLDPKLEQLEPTWHAVLEDALRIIFPTHLLQPLFPSPFAKDTLPRMRIIELYVTCLHVVYSGSNVNVSDKLEGNGLNYSRVPRILPDPCELGYDNRPGIGAKIWNCVL